ncbi:TadE family protein [Nocardioides caldifontis]|uniref:TadE family protein n=1 Tax=Nocardioides caldifontis TaxID=2588938 RepID=UPI001396A84E|nr:TadE family protein [Nocardioides caldifontis]
MPSLPGLRGCRRASRSRSQRGASAVELALVSFIFFPLMFGLIDYGMWFNDSLNARQGVREAARLGVVQEFGAGCTSSNKMECLKQIVKSETRAVAGQTAVKVLVPEGWSRRKPLIVCAAIKETGVTNLTPLPNDGVIVAETRMSIEVDTPPQPALTPGTSVEDPFPGATGSWAWCGKEDDDDA